MSDPEGIITFEAHSYGKEIFRITPTMKFVIRGDAPEAMVTIDLHDGTMIFGPDYNPDKAARVFWEAVSAEYRDYLAWKSEPPDAR